MTEVAGVVPCFLCRWTESSGKAMSIEGDYGQLVFQGRVYQDVHVRRRGMTSLPWSKPKLKLSFKRQVSCFDLDFCIQCCILRVYARIYQCTWPEKQNARVS